MRRLLVTLLFPALPALASFPHVMVAIPQTWEWDETATATSYRLYWSETPDRWCVGQYIEVAPNCVNGRCQGETEGIPDTAYITVMAVNDYGESPWDTVPREVCP